MSREKEKSAMNNLNPLIVAAYFCSLAATLPAVAAATSNEQTAAKTDADIIKWERSRAAYLRDLQFSSVAQDDTCCNDYDAKANLIKARYFIKLAEIDDMDLQKRQQASLDLRRAGYYLALAKGKVNIRDREQIQQIDDEVHTDNKVLLQTCDNTAQNQQRQGFEHLTAQLDDLVKNI
jgi:hypothetical protein